MINYLVLRGVFYTLIGSCAFVLQLILQVSSGFLAPLLDNEFSLGPFYGNILISSIFFMHIIMQVPGGILVDRFGPRLVIGFGSLLCAVGGICFSYSESFASAVFLRVVMGAGLSCSFVALSSIVANWIAKPWFSATVSLAEMLGLLGTAIVEYQLGHHIASISWRGFYFTASICALILSVIVFLVLRDSPTPRSVTINLRALRKSLRQIVRERIFWLNGIYSGSMFAIHTGFIASDAPVMLSSMPGIDYATSGKLCALILFGSVLGAMLVAFVAVRCADVKKSMLQFACICTVALTLFIWLPPAFISFRYVLALIIGVCSASYLLSFSVANQYAKPSSRSTLMGFTNTLSVMVGPILSIMGGLVLRIILMLKEKALMDDIAARSYQLSCSLFIIMLVVGVLCMLSLMRSELSTQNVSSPEKA